MSTTMIVVSVERGMDGDFDVLFATSVTRVKRDSDVACTKKASLPLTARTGQLHTMLPTPLQMFHICKFRKIIVDQHFPIALSSRKKNPIFPSIYRYKICCTDSKLTLRVSKKASRAQATSEVERTLKCEAKTETLIYYSGWSVHPNTTYTCPSICNTTTAIGWKPNRTPWNLSGDPNTPCIGI